MVVRGKLNRSVVLHDEPQAASRGHGALDHLLAVSPYPDAAPLVRRYCCPEPVSHQIREITREVAAIHRRTGSPVPGAVHRRGSSRTRSLPGRTPQQRAREGFGRQLRHTSTGAWPRAVPHRPEGRGAHASKLVLDEWGRSCDRSPPPTGPAAFARTDSVA